MQARDGRENLQAGRCLMWKVDKVDQSLTLATIRISIDRYAVVRSAPT